MANCNHKYIIYATWICRGSLTASTWSHQIRIWRVWSWLCFENRSVARFGFGIRLGLCFYFYFCFCFYISDSVLLAAASDIWSLNKIEAASTGNCSMCQTDTETNKTIWNIIIIARSSPTYSIVNVNVSVEGKATIGAGWAADCQFHGQVNNFLSRQLQECQLWSSSSSRNRNQPVMPANWYSNCSYSLLLLLLLQLRQQPRVKFALLFLVGKNVK